MKLNVKQFQHTNKAGARSGVVPGVNISALARKAGMERSRLSALVNGRHEPGVKSLGQLKVALGVGTVDEVIEWLKSLRNRS